MKFTNTDDFKSKNYELYYMQRQVFLSLLKSFTSWLPADTVADQVQWQVFNKFNSPRYKIKQEIKK